MGEKKYLLFASRAMDCGASGTPGECHAGKLNKIERIECVACIFMQSIFQRKKLRPSVTEFYRRPTSIDRVFRLSVHEHFAVHGLHGRS